jgi:pyridoxine 5-phosphate synthase
MAALSVNINKVALIRNSRGGNLPDVLQVARDCERFGADGITVHPRPDQRHIRYDDVRALKMILTTEFNVEGYPSEHFINLMREVKPHQCTLVPDAPNALTSNEGWDTIKHEQFLTDVVKELQSYNIRVSIFVEPIEQLIEGAKKTNAERIELYTGPYAANYAISPSKAIEKYIIAARYADQIGIGVNAGHDLNLQNLKFFSDHIPNLLEVSIGHALISDALYFGLENTIQLYKRLLQK